MTTYFKTEKQLSDCDMLETVYVAENSEQGEFYTKKDFLELCGNIEEAQLLLDRLEWQHPSTLLEEDKLFG